ncbi:hypothetical protein L1276_003783 [Flavobacterium sp. HSC-32F16]|nr:hypothetical protein [Flavobacterium sp. HSC-32F16]MDQ1166312.1 hypothetical protein [Flavobacterium sp. SORGH_AS_0622]PBJ09273.1 hypothetical protein BSF42_33330 [Flavobacterium sp. ACN6]TDX09713.1 hypothetical protein EDB96_3299 [Flavobacterium sp. S87F.05.LMB.W.Kidney.N]
MENYITTALVAIIIGIAYISYRISKDLETRKDTCTEI